MAVKQHSQTDTHPARDPGIARRLLREPMSHFLAIGLAVFLLYGRGAEAPEVRQDAVISVTSQRVEQLAEQFAAIWRRPPSEVELAGLVEDHVREEVYYREALALGLDRDDVVIRRRLRQKMEFLTEAFAVDSTLDDAALRRHYAAHPERFERTPRVTFQQVTLGDRDPAEALAALASGAAPEEVGRGTLLPPAMQGAEEASVDGTFGDGFFAALAGLAPGSWQGLAPSAFGRHLVRVDEFTPAANPPFEAVRAAVEADWRRQLAADAREAGYQALRERYEVVLPGPADAAK